MLLMLYNMFQNYINSNNDFKHDEVDLKLRYNIINLTIILAITGLIYGMVNNIIKGDHIGVGANAIFISVILITAYCLRIFKNHFDLMTTVITIQFLILFNLLLVISGPESLKHLWLMTFPSLIFFYKGTRSWLIWVGVFIFSLFITKTQTIVPIAYSYGEIIYISVVILIMTAIVYFYKNRIDDANHTIVHQKEQLESLTKALESKVQEKTKELNQLNHDLELKVHEKAKELVKKDALILAQSRQAAMGEMISMIAHQWRQPLSTITLQISNLKINSLLGKQTIEETNNALEHISSTIIYLSETIDDFQNFFNPNKKCEDHDLCEIITRGTSFAKPRLSTANIDLILDCQEDITINTYANEFSQVIINILNNSIDVLLERKINKPCICVTAKKIDEALIISISDNAGGIDDNIIHQVFEPYFSTKGKNGTGLGLYMSTMIIEKELGGLIRVANTSKGAEFIITLSQ